jgi:hypothetical protein
MRVHGKIVDARAGEPGPTRPLSSIWDSDVEITNYRGRIQGVDARNPADPDGYPGGGSPVYPAIRDTHDKREGTGFLVGGVR